MRRRLPPLRGLVKSLPHLTAACCAAACALETGALPRGRAIKAAAVRLERAWRAHARRLPWATVAEHMRHLPPLREHMRLARMRDVAAEEGSGFSVDAHALAADLFGGVPGRALLLESAPCALLVKLRDGVWGGNFATMEFQRLASAAKVTSFIHCAVKEGPCPAAELTSL
jgi:hypothetical protein